MDNSDERGAATTDRTTSSKSDFRDNTIRLICDKMETDIDLAVKMSYAQVANGASHFEENGIAEDEVPPLEINGSGDHLKVPTAAENGHDIVSLSLNGMTPTKSMSVDIQTEDVLPFSQYKGEGDEERAGEGKSDEREESDVMNEVQIRNENSGSVSPVKSENGSASQLRRISSKDIYPDREAETMEASSDEDDSSDEENDRTVLNHDGRSSPKARRKQRSDAHSLMWSDADSHTVTMHHLDVFRRSKQFCDLILQVGGRELYCHRVIVGGSSRFLYKELAEGEHSSAGVNRISLNQFQPALAPDAVESLVDYMYTSKLIVPQGQLTSVYRASVKLRVERVMPVCRRYIINGVNAENSVETWRLASNVEDLDLLTVLDEYIEENFEAITKSNEFLALPRIKMVATSSVHPPDGPPLHILPRDSALSQLALSWVKGMVKKKGGRYMEDLTEQIQKIPIEELTNNVSYTSSSSSASSTSMTSSPGSNLQSQNLLTTGDPTKTSPQQRLSRTSSIDSLSSSSSEENSDCNRCKPEGQWKVIASMQSADHMIALCFLGDILSSLSLHLPTSLIANPNFYTSNGNHSNCVSTSSSSSHSCASSVGSVSDLSHLSQARCAAGVTSLNGKIYAIGGYNQSECLDTAECYDPCTNRWTMLSRMGERRARFTAAVLRGQIYAVGGSTGSRDQLSVEVYDPEMDKWSQAPPLPIRCSGVGVATMNDCLFCVGGLQQNSGVAGIKLCHMFDPGDQAWRGIAQLNTGRSFAGVAELNNFLYCVGGTDGWAILTSVERYDGEKWIKSAPLNVPRRGAGLAKHNNMLYCVGGSDGGSFWNSVEHYSPDSDCWTIAQSSMTVPRSNVGLVSLNGLLFAVGGFSGRQFLNSVETLDESGEEWTTHDTHVLAAVATSCSNAHSEYDEESPPKDS